MRRSALLRGIAAAPVASLAVGAGEKPREIDTATAVHVFGETKRAWRDRAIPPFVVYTISRETRVNFSYSLDGSYRDRVWYRTADGVALTRRFDGGRASGPMRLEAPTFDAAKDPGPPTADIFSLPLLALAPSPASSDAPVIGHAVVRAEYDYTVGFARIERENATERLHMGVRASREPDRNRLQELWIDPTTYAVTRVKARDHLFLIDEKQRVIDVTPETFDMRFTTVRGVPVIARIEAHSMRRDGNLDQATYTFDDVAFPPTLPDWYFDAASYGTNAKAAPTF